MHETLVALAPQQVFLLQGDNTVATGLVATLKEKGLFPFHCLYTRFTIDDAKALVSWATENAGQESWCVLYFDIFVYDAAQVLLKTLEEPGRGVHIILVTAHPYLIPQTIRSRVRLITAKGDTTSERTLFTKASATLYIKEYLGNEDIDASERRALATTFLDTLEVQMRAMPQKTKVIYEGKSMLYKANMPTKQVAEYVVSMAL